MYRRILVVVENDAATSAAVAEGITLAREHACELVFLAIVPDAVAPLVDYPVVGIAATDALLRAADSKAQSDLDDARQRAVADGVPSLAAKVVGQPSAECVIEQTKRLSCDLIIIESLGNNSVMRLLGGSLIPGLITLATLPVLVVRHRAASTAQDADLHRHADTAPSSDAMPRTSADGLRHVSARH